MSSSLQTIIRDLRRRRGRERRGLALAEGVRLVEEALRAGVAFRGAAVAPALESSPRGRELAAALERRSVPLERMDDRALAGLADTEHPQGIVAVIEPPHPTLSELFPAAGEVVLVLDAVQDPGNVGTMLRTALALGVAGVIALDGTAELTNPKVLRGAMGAHFHRPAVMARQEEFLAWCAERKAELWVADMDGEPVQGRPAAPLALVVGNEGAGVREALRERAARRVGIPLAAGAESLNVAVAAGILLYEVMRER